MSQETIQQAMVLAQQGEMTEARKLLMDMLRAQPDDLSGWGNLYRLCYNDTERRVCLQHILRLRPGDEWATARMEELETTGIVPESAEETVEFGAKKPELAPAAGEEAEEAAAAAEQEDAVAEEAAEAEPESEPEAEPEPEPEPAAEAEPEPEADLVIAPAAEAEAVEEEEPEPETEAEPEPEAEPTVTVKPIPDMPEAEPSTKPVIISASEMPAVGTRRDRAPGDTLEGASLPYLVTHGVLTVKAAAFLKAAMLARISFLVSGEWVADANAMLSTLESVIPPDAPERLVQPELDTGNVMMFAAAMLAGGGAIGSVEAASVQSALRQLENLMSTAHPDDILRHREIIVGGLEALIHVGRTRVDAPVVTAIYEVIGLQGDGLHIEPIFVYDEDEGLQPTGHRPAIMNTIEQVGLALPREVFLPG